MKRITLLLAGLMLISCAKETQFATLTFNSPYVESHSFTKATRAEAINQLVTSKMPASVDLEVKSLKTGTRYTTRIGDVLVLPIGDYSVYGETENRTLMGITGTTAKVMDAPDFYLSERVTLVQGENNKTLKATFTCIAFVIEKTEVERLTIRTPRLAETEIPMEDCGDYKIAFIGGVVDQQSQVMVYPVDKENNDPKAVMVTHTPGQKAVCLQRGMYYVFHPMAVERVESGFNYDIPNMNENDLK